MRCRLLLGAGLVVVAGCAGTGPQGGAYGRAAWRAVVEAHGVEPAEAVYPFQATEEMRRWAAEVTRNSTDPVNRLLDLQAALFDGERFSFQYESRLTVSARKAFELRRGNCLSFTSLFIALGRSLDMDLRLVTVRRVAGVSERENLVVINRHVVAGFPRGTRLYAFDFYVAGSRSYVGHHVVDDVTASALFHTNLGAAALQEGDLARGRTQLELATRLDPEAAVAWVNLGVARRLAGDVEGAMEAYRTALGIVPGDPVALTNLAHAYQSRGMVQEAKTALRAAAEGPASPFSLIALAQMEAGQGRRDEAKRYLLQARRRYGGVPEVWEALARLAREGGRPEQAERYVRKATALRRRAVPNEVGEPTGTAAHR